MSVKSKCSPTEALTHLCKPLVLTDENIKEYMKRFLDEMEFGLSKKTHDDATVRCEVSYIQEFPNGTEKGMFLGIEIGAPVFRCFVVQISGKHFDLSSKIYTIPPRVLSAPGRQLFDFVTDCLFHFCKDNDLLNTRLPLGFTFNFPVQQMGLASAKLVRWTEGFHNADVVGKDIIKLLQESIELRPEILVDICSLVTESVGTLMAGSYKDKETNIGLVIGTSYNASYVEDVENTQTFRSDREKRTVVVNTECCSFGDNGKLDFLRTQWDKEVDKSTDFPGIKLLEKMVASTYVGELVRLVLVTAAKKNIIFGGKVTEKMGKRGEFLTKYMADVESDKVGSVVIAKKVLKEMGYQTPSRQDCVDLRYVSECVSRRSCTLVAAVIATLLNKMGRPKVTVAVDGNMFRYHPGYPILLEDKITQLCDPKIQFRLTLMEDGGARGAALVAAVVVREKRESQKMSRMEQVARI